MEQKLEFIGDGGDKKYFTIIPNIIVDSSNSITQSLYLIIKRIAGDDGKCYATKKTLMKIMGIGNEKFNIAMNTLLKNKWIEYVGKTEGKTRPINTYRVVNIWSENDKFISKKISSKRGVSKIDKFQNDTMISSRTALEEEPNTKEEKTIAKSIFLSLSFEEFWNEYPRKISKKKSKEIWMRISPSGELNKKIISSVKEAKRSEQWENEKYIPHPTTWLNQQRWDDELKNNSLEDIWKK